MKTPIKKDYINKDILKKFLNLKIDEEKKFFIILDLIRRELFMLIKQEIEKVRKVSGN